MTTPPAHAARSPAEAVNLPIPSASSLSSLSASASGKESPSKKPRREQDLKAYFAGFAAAQDREEAERRELDGVSRLLAAYPYSGLDRTRPPEQQYRTDPGRGPAPFRRARWAVGQPAGPYDPPNAANQAAKSKHD